MSENKHILNWYLEAGVDEVIEDKPINHFEAYANKKKEKEVMVNLQKSNVQDPVKSMPASANSSGKNYNAIAREAVTKVKNLDDLYQEIENFEGCSFIKSLAQNTVISRGNPDKADIMIIGEAPGANEDEQGVPFCGQSGQLLDSMLKSSGLYDRVYITNTTFWRPPGNRTPTEEELFSCRPFVEKHIELVFPKLIIAMGGTAMKVVLNKSSGVTGMRRNFFDYTNEYLGEKSIKATPLFHPSYLLRQPIKKRDAWKDWLIIMEFLDSVKN